MKPHLPYTIRPSRRVSAIALAKKAAEKARLEVNRCREKVWAGIRRDIGRGRSSFGHPLADQLILSLGQSVLHEDALLESIATRTMTNVAAISKPGNTIVFVIEYEKPGTELHFSQIPANGGIPGDRTHASLIPESPRAKEEHFIVFAGITSGDSSAVSSFIQAILPPKNEKGKVSLEQVLDIPPSAGLTFDKFVMFDSGTDTHPRPESPLQIQTGRVIITGDDNLTHLRHALLGLRLRDFNTYIYGNFLCLDDLEISEGGIPGIKRSADGRWPKYTAYVDRVLSNLYRQLNPEK